MELPGKLNYLLIEDLPRSVLPISAFRRIAVACPAVNRSWRCAAFFRSTRRKSARISPSEECTDEFSIRCPISCAITCPNNPDKSMIPRFEACSCLTRDKNTAALPLERNANPIAVSVKPSVSGDGSMWSSIARLGAAHGSGWETLTTAQGTQSTTTHTDLRSHAASPFASRSGPFSTASWLYNFTGSGSNKVQAL